MDQRYATNPTEIPGLTTEGLRERFLVEDLFVPGEVRTVYTHHDRIVLGGALPGAEPVTLPNPAELRAEYFLERREVGIVNVGSTGTVTADGETYELPNCAVLYIGSGTRDVSFAGEGAAFYLFSAPAHTSYPTVLTLPGEGNTLELGDQVTSNRRSLEQVVHANGVQSCQVVMGVTRLHAGSMWNTMPAHTHDRRTECYLYFDLDADARVLHLCGEPSETRHLVVADRQAIISPSWSVHSGVGTSSYAFVWAMAGENQDFTDMDAVPPTDIR